MIRTDAATATVEVPCTCGELLQGVLEGEPFLVSCPIDRYSRVTLSLARYRADSVHVGQGPVPSPSHAKAVLAAEATLELLGQRGRPFDLAVDCPLPPSKGFGTSTADVAATIVATAAAAGATLSPAEVASLAVSVEPSDGTMLPGLALFSHRSGKPAVSLGGAPHILVAVLEFAGTVDTLEYNARLDVGYLRSMEPAYAHAFDLLRRGLQTGRPELIGEAATLSARINQRLLPKPRLEEAIELGERHGALGVCAAHSGTVLGVLFRPDEERQARSFLDAAADRLRGMEGHWLTRIVGGGARVLSATPSSQLVTAATIDLTTELPISADGATDSENPFSQQARRTQSFTE